MKLLVCAIALEGCEAEERAWLVQLAEYMIVLPEVAF